MPSDEGDTPLHDAAKNGHVEAVEKLMHGRADLHITNSVGFFVSHSITLWCIKLETFEVVVPSLSIPYYFRLFFLFFFVFSHTFAFEFRRMESMNDRGPLSLQSINYRTTACVFFNRSGKHSTELLSMLMTD